MKRKWLACLVSVAMMALQPAVLLAQDQSYDARLEGYGNPVTLKVSPLVTWVTALLLAAICVGVMLMRASRSKD